MDNNAAERALRGPGWGAKLLRFGQSVDARLAAVLFTILQTLELWQINPQRWLSASAILRRARATGHRRN